MTSALYVSLGHNSSAVLAYDYRVVRGYEQERIDRRKSSSAYPREAIELALGNHDGPVRTAYVSHWFDDYALESNKYLDVKHLADVAERIVMPTPDWTHHDMHANSAFSFYRSHEKARDDRMYVVVMDGFGNQQECFSFYEAHPDAGVLKVKHRTYGYDMSLGLMYQYATSTIGLKENQDEYKMLGYEAHVLRYIPLEVAERARAAVVREAHVHAHRMLYATRPPTPDGGLIDYEMLRRAKLRWQTRIRGWLEFFPLAREEEQKVFVAFAAQTFLEAATEFLLNELLPRNLQRTLVLTGGCFYNVKLNRTVQNRKERPLVFVHPLAGDQGAAMGHTPELEHPRGLLIGDREIGPDTKGVAGVFPVSSQEWVEVAFKYLEQDFVVNVVRGAMEYGPRALCNTTTFALPTRKNVNRINAYNDRDDAMPMAPVMTPVAAARFFDSQELLRVSESDRYMITTVRFKQEPNGEMSGVSHKDPLKDVWTARPQVVYDDPDLLSLLRRFENGTLINTSFNYHGEPIIHTTDQAIATYERQLEHSISGSVVTLLVQP